MLSKACEYAIRAVVQIAHTSMNQERVGLKAIAAAIDSPVAFTGKIMQQLSRSGIVQSIKGPSGGFWMDEASRQSVSIRDVVEVIDGDKLYVKCGLGLSQCSDANPCPVHDQYKDIRAKVIDMHSNTLVAELARKLDEKATLK
jgi:Rrf2 family protein